jgi:hypothetical protein
MAFFKRMDKERVYVIKIVLPGDTVVHKIGMTNTPRSVDRMMEILRSWFMAYRFVPYAELRLDMECRDAYKLEQYIHKILSNNRFEPDLKVDGGTEMFIGINELRVIQFLKAYGNSSFIDPPNLTKQEFGTINRLLTQ